LTNITFFGGVEEIGGNKILLEDNSTKIFLDFGMGFKRRGLYFEEFLSPRTANGIGDFLELKLLPDIKGIYRQDLLEHLGRKAEQPDISGVILSHAHADHANYISFLHKDIPIHCGETCKNILYAVDEQSQRNLESEVVNFKQRPIFRRTYEIDSIEIQPIHIDHSVPGAYGFIIHTSEETIVYTGDIRMHGLHAEMTTEFLNAATQVKPKVIITEGTRIDREKTNESEKKVYNESKKHITNCKNLSIVDFNFKDVDRFTTFYKIAKELGKKLVISFKHACFLERYHKDKKLKTPNSTDENIFLLKPKRKTGTYNDEDYSEKYIKKRLEYPNILTSSEIKQKLSNYIVVLNFWDLTNLVDIKPKNSIYIHSLSEPFNEEMEISYERMRNWLNHFDLKFIQSHCSGHINGTDLKELIQTINPKIIYPIHTEHPEMFKNFSTKVEIVKEGKMYKL